MYVESPIILIVHNDMCRINVSVKDILNFVSRAYKHCAAVTVFSKLNKLLLGYFDPTSVVVYNENKQFTG